MRVEKFLPFRPSQDPTRSGSVRESFVSEAIAPERSYDIYLVDGSIFVCYEGFIAIYGPQGTAYVGPEMGRAVCDSFAKRWPRKKQEK